MRKFLFTSLSVVSLTFGVSQTVLAQSTPIPTDDAPEANETPQVDFVFDEAPDEHAIGEATAPLTMITYASVTCGHCGNWFSNEWPTIQKALVDTGKMRFVLRELPTPPAVLSMTGFLIAACAPDEDYFDVIQYQMENQKDIFDAAQAGKGQEAYAKVGALAGLNTDEEINACLSDPTKMDQLRKAGERADAAKIQGVPAFFVNGEAYKGKQDAETIVALIEEMTEKGLSSLPEIEPAETHDKHDGHDH